MWRSQSDVGNVVDAALQMSPDQSASPRERAADSDVSLGRCEHAAAQAGVHPTAS